MIQQTIKCRMCKNGRLHYIAGKRVCDTCPYKCKIPWQAKHNDGIRAEATTSGDRELAIP